MNVKAGVSVDLAQRLRVCLDGTTAESWLKGRLAYDLGLVELYLLAVSIRRAQAA